MILSFNQVSAWDNTALNVQWVITNSATVVEWDSTTMNWQHWSSVSTITERWFELWETDTPYLVTTYVSLSWSSPFLFNLTWLNWGTPYSYKAYAKNANWTTYWDVVSFTTKPSVYALVIAWGGGGWAWWNEPWMWGGWAWGMVEWIVNISYWANNITIWTWGIGWVWLNWNWTNWWNTVFGNITAIWGGASVARKWNNWWSWGGWVWTNLWTFWNWTVGQGNNWWAWVWTVWSSSHTSWGGGWGKWGPWGNATLTTGWAAWLWLASSISWSSITYATGGKWGASRFSWGVETITLRNWVANTGEWGSWGGWTTSANWGNWWSWIVIIRYKTDWSEKISTASTWGVISTSWIYTLHTFTASGTFTAVAF